MPRFIIIAARDIPADVVGWDWLRDEEFCWCILDTKLHTVVGHDGGEPEDQLLIRDWSWVVGALNAVAEEASSINQLSHKHEEGG